VASGGDRGAGAGPKSLIICIADHLFIFVYLPVFPCFGNYVIFVNY